jgi:cell division protein FtsW
MQQGRNHIDLMTLVAVLTLMVLSLGVVYSAGATWFATKAGGSNGLLLKHAVKVFLGIIAIFIVMHIDYRTYRKVTKPALLGAVGLLMVTLVLGGEAKGATRWLGVGGFVFQPSEFAKFALLFHLCVLMASKREQIRDFKTGFLPMVVWIGSVIGLVLLQPNFSTAAMIFCISLVMLYIGHARLTHIAVTLGMLVPLLVLFMLTAEYRMRRIMTFLGGAETTAVSSYQLRQGIIGFGNGGLFGVGPGLSRQRDLFLPESYGDFVFSIVGEEYGLIGTLFVLSLFLMIMLRGMKIAKYSRDEFGRLLAYGITTTITLYALINAGVTLGILPTTGLPMPFVSYGGSSMLFSSIAIGVLLNISSQTDLHPRLAEAPEGIRPLEPIQLPAQGRA